MSVPQQTDERLRSWLDGQQLARERMCLAVLSLDKRFRMIKPRNPRGGRDGSRDIEAIYEDGRPAWIAVGFRNSANDSSAERSRIISKFKKDLDSAKQTNKSLGVFVFFTNVALTTGDRNILIAYAKSKGVDIVDVCDRERIRIVLDGVDGLAIRYQYLGIVLSETEQAAFFARWGSGIESLITDSMAAVETRLARLEFFLERSQPLTRFGYVLWLKEEVSRDVLGHFRADLVMHFNPPRKDGITFHLGLCDDRGGLTGAETKRKDCMCSMGWTVPMGSDNPEEILHNSQGLIPVRIRNLGAQVSNTFFRIPLLDLRLNDLEGTLFVLFVNEKLSTLIDKVLIYANEYLIWSAGLDELQMDAHNYKKKWPCDFTQEELQEPWIRVMSKRGAVAFDFSSVTPFRLYRARAIERPVLNKNA